MLGAIIGDIVGSVYEWNNIKTKDFTFFSPECFFTDDTVMTIAIAQALMNGASEDEFIKALKKFGGLYPDEDYGIRFKNWLISEDSKPYDSWGNGSAMRVSAVAYEFNTLSEVEEYAKKSAIITHNHPEGIKGAQATAAAIFMARNENGKDEIKKYIEDKYGYDLDRTIDDIRKTYSFNESAQGTVPEAIIAFLESKDFEDAIRNAISIGGDSDTLAAITGSIAEAAYGIPNDLRDKALSILDETLRSVYLLFFKRNGKKFMGYRDKICI